MSNNASPDDATQLTRKIIDMSLRLGIILALLIFCFWIIWPFFGALAWGAILALTYRHFMDWLARERGAEAGSAEVDNSEGAI